MKFVGKAFFAAEGVTLSGARLMQGKDYKPMWLWRSLLSEADAEGARRRGIHANLSGKRTETTKKTYDGWHSTIGLLRSRFYASLFALRTNGTFICRKINTKGEMVNGTDSINC